MFDRITSFFFKELAVKKGVIDVDGREFERCIICDEKTVSGGAGFAHPICSSCQALNSDL